MIEVAFSHSAGTVTAILPSDPAQLIPGHYLLFVLVDDVPSVGRTVQVGRAGTTGIDEPTEAPAALVLTAAPNPMHEIATLTFTLPRPGRVVLTLYDARGATIRRVLAEEREAGTHTVPLDGRDLASGVYFGRLAFEGRTVTTPVVRLR